MKLYNTDFVLLDKENNMASFADETTIIYEDYNEAKKDKLDTEIIVKTTDLPLYLQEKLLKELQ